ncbi:MAG: DUF108 domain-containing protein [Bacteroidales bacterium]|nr:DUF108 domain-containing protein [Bacteroidales bacterium]
MKTLGIFGCGGLSEIVVDALINGLLPNYRLIGTMSRTLSSAQYLANKVNSVQKATHCDAFDSIDEFLALKPDIIVETASPSALKTFVLEALKNGSSVVPLSMGAFADDEFYEEVQKTALKSGAKVYIPSGAIGGLDVLRTVSLMEKASVKFNTEKSPDPLVNSEVYDEQMKTLRREVFNGNAKEAIALFPTQVNVSVAAALASVGTNDINVSINTTPDYIGDEHCITINSEDISAKLCIYSKTAKIAGWSVVNTLRNITSPIVF